MNNKISSFYSKCELTKKTGAHQMHVIKNTKLKKFKFKQCNIIIFLYKIILEYMNTCTLCVYFGYLISPLKKKLIYI